MHLNLIYIDLKEASAGWEGPLGQGQMALFYTQGPPCSLFVAPPPAHRSPLLQGAFKLIFFKNRRSEKKIIIIVWILKMKGIWDCPFDQNEFWTDRLFLRPCWQGEDNVVPFFVSKMPVELRKWTYIILLTEWQKYQFYFSIIYILWCLIRGAEEVDQLIFTTEWTGSLSLISSYLILWCLLRRGGEVERFHNRVECVPFFFILILWCLLGSCEEVHRPFSLMEMNNIAYFFHFFLILCMMLAQKRLGNGKISLLKWNETFASFLILFCFMVLAERRWWSEPMEWIIPLLTFLVLFYFIMHACSEEVWKGPVSLTECNEYLCLLF